MVFKSPAELGAAIASYYTAPEKVEKEYMVNRVNATNEIPHPTQQEYVGMDVAREPVCRNETSSNNALR